VSFLYWTDAAFLVFVGLLALLIRIPRGGEG
jgi:hypothetical protein